MAGGGSNGGGQAGGNPPAAAASAASAGVGGPPAMNAPGMPMPAGMMAPDGMFGMPPAGQAPMPAGQYRPPTGTTSHAQQSHAQQGAQVLDAQLTTFWTEQQTEVESATDFKNHLLPLARIKKIMKSDEDVRMISAEAPVLFAKACEMFILELTLRAWAQTEEAKRRTLQRSDISAAIQKTDIFDFLIDIVPRDEPKKEVGAPVAGFPGAVPGGVMPPAGAPVSGYYGMPNAGMAPYMSQADPAAAAMMYQQHQQQQQMIQQQQQQQQQQQPGQQPSQQQMYYGAATSTAGGAGNMYGGANPAMAGNANLQQFMRLQQQQQQQQQMFLQQQQQQQPYQNFNGHYGSLMPEGQQGQPGAPPAQQPPQQ